jgi:D-cysteine desulfhydrase
MRPAYPDRIRFAHLPTSVQELKRLSEYLGGPRLLIKRDDQTGLATGGNKTRKLEFLVADAAAKGCDYLVTTGAPQSNHCRQTAAAAAHVGMGCGLVLRGSEMPADTGNLLLDQLLGADLFWTGTNSVRNVIANVVAELRSAGHKPYVIPLGGSNVLGAASYTLAMRELTEQLKELETSVEAIVVASSSGGTQSGLQLGAVVYGYEGRVIGISVEHPGRKLRTQVVALTAATAMHLGVKPGSFADSVEVYDDYLGEGYGVMDDLEREAISTMAKLEGILLDPVYTGRAMGGLLDLIDQGQFSQDQTVLFWHTGGTPALFAYGENLL